MNGKSPYKKADFKKFPGNMQLVLDHTGLRVKVKNGCFYINNAEQSRLISPARVTSILIASPITITSSALMLAVRNNIPVIITDAKQGFHATLTSAAYSNLPACRRWQLLFCGSDAGLTYMAELLLKKFEQQINNLRTWQKQLEKHVYSGESEPPFRAK